MGSSGISAQVEGLASDINMYSSCIFTVGEATAYSKDSVGSCGGGSLNAHLHGIEANLNNV